MFENQQITIVYEWLSYNVTDYSQKKLPYEANYEHKQKEHYPTAKQ